MEKLTKGQEKIYSIIKKYIDKNGYPPTIREICEISKLSSPATVHNYLKILKRKKYINYIEKCSRTIKIIGE